MFAVFDTVAWGDRLIGSERFDFEHVGVGEGLKIAAAVGIPLPLSIFKRLDKQEPLIEIPDPSLSVSDAKLGGSGGPGVLSEGQIARSPAIAGICQVRKWPEDQGLVRNEPTQVSGSSFWNGTGMRNLGREWNDRRPSGGHHRKGPRGQFDSPEPTVA